MKLRLATYRFARKALEIHNTKKSSLETLCKPV